MLYFISHFCLFIPARVSPEYILILWEYQDKTHLLSKSRLQTIGVLSFIQIHPVAFA